MALIPVHRDAATSSFFDGTSRGQFLLIRDTQTGEILDPKADTSFDPTRFEHISASGAAVVVTWSAPHTRLPGGGVHRSLVGIVQLEEGPWWWTELRGFTPDEDPTDSFVHIEFERSGDGEGDETIPVFVKS